MTPPRLVEEWQEAFDAFCETLAGDEDFSFAVAMWIAEQVAQARQDFGCPFCATKEAQIAALEAEMNTLRDVATYAQRLERVVARLEAQRTP